MAKTALCLEPYEDQRGTAFQRGLLALQKNDLTTALVEITTAEEENPQDATIRNFRGIVLARAGRNAEAAAEYREAIRIKPRMQEAYRNAGFLEWTEHELDAARSDLLLAVQMSPDDSFAHYYLGRVELDAQRYTEAIAELGRVGFPLPKDPEFLIAEATGYAALGRAGESGKIVDLLTKETLNVAQSSRVAALLLALHQNDAAFHLLQRWDGAGSCEEAPWASLDLGVAYVRAGEYQLASIQAHRCTAGLHRAAEVAQAWTVIGVAQAHMSNADGATEAFRHAAELAPEQEEHWLNLTRELMDLSRYKDAIEATQQGIVACPNSYALQLRLGAANLSVDRYDEAEKIFRALILAGDPLPTSYVGLAQVLLRTGRAEEAANELAIARQALGASFLLSYFQGLALNRAGKTPEAISAFREALQENPSSAEAHVGLGKAELQEGNAREAAAELEEALHLSPGDKPTERLLKQAYRRSGDAKYVEVGSGMSPAELVGDFILPPWREPTLKESDKHDTGK